MVFADEGDAGPVSGVASFDEDGGTGRVLAASLEDRLLPGGPALSIAADATQEKAYRTPKIATASGLKRVTDIWIPSR
jgi:hypothetical protein